MNRYLAIGAVGCALMFGCSLNSNNVAGGGGDDFPNSATAASLGRRIADDLDGYSAWNDNLQPSQDLPGIATDAGLDIPSALPATAKRRAATVDSIVAAVDSSDTALGIIRWTTMTFGDGFTRYDTLTFSWDQAYRDNIPGNEHIVSGHGITVYTALGSSLSYRYDDADGDGIINNEARSRWRASATFVTALGGYRETANLVIDAGPDLDFDTDSDNVIIAGSYVKTNAADTLEFYHLLDADGDSAVLDMAADSCVVDLESQSRPAFLLARQNSAWMKARYVVFPADSTKNYLIRFMGAETSAAGSLLASVLGTRADSTFFPRDTVTGTVITRTSSGACTAIDSVQLVARLGPVPQDSVDDSLISVFAHSIRCAGPERDIVFSFTNTAPLAKGRKPVAGTLSCMVTYDTNAWARAEGRFDATSIRAVFTDSQGNNFVITWDRKGNVVSYTETQ